MKNETFKPTAAGKYRESRNKRNSLVSSPTNSSRSPYVTDILARLNNQNQAKNQQFTGLLEKLRNEWRSRNVNTQSLEALQGLINVLQSEEGKKYVKTIVSGAGNVVKKIPYEKVVNTVTKDQNLSDLLKNLGENGNATEMLSNMMNNPEMKKTAMDMMQEMMRDEKKVAELTDLMSKMLNPDKES